MFKQYCDKCGKDVTGQLKQKVITNYIAPNGNMSYGIDINGRVNPDEHTEKVICTDCWEEFKAFMNIK